MIDFTIMHAIAERRLLEFRYDGRARLIQPHVLGTKGARYELLALQIDGHTSPGHRLPDWRRFEVSRIKGLKVRDEGFPGPRDASFFQESSWDHVIALVRVSSSDPALAAPG